MIRNMVPQSIPLLGDASAPAAPIVPQSFAVATSVPALLFGAPFTGRCGRGGNIASSFQNCRMRDAGLAVAAVCAAAARSRGLTQRGIAKTPRAVLDVRRGPRLRRRLPSFWWQQARIAGRRHAATGSGDGLDAALHNASTAAQGARAELQRYCAARLSKQTIRVLSGLAIGSVLGPATFGGGWFFGSLVMLVVYCMSHEYCDILDKVLLPRLAPGLRPSLCTVSLLTLLAAQVGIRTGVFESGACTMLIMLLLLQGSGRSPDNCVAIQFAHIASQIFGVFYIGYLPAFWIRLRTICLPLDIPGSPPLLALTRILHWPFRATVGACASVSCVMCIIAADSCAYFGGRRWGKRPLTRVSPRKTVEGAVCGWIGALLMALLCNWGWGSPASVYFAVACGTIIFCASLLGDLVVSALKRDSGVKDAGNLIPGHGGVLDRFDSYFFAAPAAYFCWYMLLQSRGVPAESLHRPFPAL